MIFFVYPLMGEKYEVVGHVVGSRVKNVGDKITKSGLNGVKPSSLFNFLPVLSLYLCLRESLYVW